MTPDLARPLSKQEESELAALLQSHDGAMGLTEARGFFAAIGSIPAMVQPGTWLSAVVGRAEFEDQRDMERTLGLLLRAYNGVLTQLEARDPSICPPGDDWEETEAWCCGYRAGVSHTDDQATELPGVLRPLDVIDALCGELQPSAVDEDVEDDDAWFEAESRKLSGYVFELHERWEQVRRADAPVAAPAPAPKVGRNDPCPCGSGKKHKKCCLN